MRLILSIILALGLTVPSVTGETESTDDLKKAVKAFSDSMTIGGGGWEDYVSHLHPGFTRWTHGQEVADHDTFAKSIREWWDYGMRVSDGRSRIVDITIRDEMAIVRLERFETYVDGDGEESGSFHGFVTQLWIVEDGDWKLMTLDVAPAPKEE